MKIVLSTVLGACLALGPPQIYAGSLPVSDSDFPPRDTAKEDLGKVIGKQGRTARAVRTILNASGMKLKKRFVLEILE